MNHVAPPSWVPAITPPTPTAQPSRGPGKAMPWSAKLVGNRVACHDPPPSTVRRTSPDPPTTHPLSDPANWTSNSASPTPTLRTRAQDWPPSEVCSTVPLLPTAQPSAAVLNHSPFRLKVVPLGGRLQVTPASVVRTMVPPDPTATPVRPSAWKKTALSSDDVPLAWRTQPVSANTVTQEVSRWAPDWTNSGAVPSPTPVTRPPPVTVKIRESPLAHWKPTVTTLSSVS